MREAVVVEVIRTPIGKRNGALRSWHPADLAGHVLAEVVQRADIDPGVIDDVIVGCVHQVGEQALNIGRNAVLSAGFPISVPGTTVERQCGSGQQAIHFAAQGVIAGAYDVVVAAGVECLSRVPMMSNVEHGPGLPFGPKMRARFNLGNGLINQGLSAEMIADKWGLSREALDQFGLESHRRAAKARTTGCFDDEIVPVPVEGGVFDADEGIRKDTSLERLASLRPVFKEDGVVTAGTSSQISDGAAAAIIMSTERANQLGLRPRAVIREFALAGDDPIMMLTAVIPATAKLLDRAHIGVDDVDAFEINEAFASVVLAWLAETGADPSLVNPNGGAIALGHPVGCSGVRLAATLVHHLERTGGRYGLQAMCEGGGLANALLVERA